jgi:hypothetical protein
VNFTGLCKYSNSTLATSRQTKYCCIPVAVSFAILFLSPSVTIVIRIHSSVTNQCQHPVPPSPLRSRVRTRGGSPHCSCRLHVQSVRQTLQEPQRVAKTPSQTCHRCRKSANDHWKLIKKTRSIDIESYGRLGKNLRLDNKKLQIIYRNVFSDKFYVVFIVRYLSELIISMTAVFVLYGSLL